mmetsp:Transcript_45539/g.99477  ORF Transcript_45539/g.99477 Transcript_45539/m.99477 type:complete len:201 (-) Transcript_45539:32-634(-)
MESKLILNASRPLSVACTAPTSERTLSCGDTSTDNTSPPGTSSRTGNLSLEAFLLGVATTRKSVIHHATSETEASSPSLRLCTHSRCSFLLPFSTHTSSDPPHFVFNFPFSNISWLLPQCTRELASSTKSRIPEAENSSISNSHLLGISTFSRAADKISDPLIGSSVSRLNSPSLASDIGLKQFSFSTYSTKYSMGISIK